MKLFLLLVCISVAYAVVISSDDYFAITKDMSISEIQGMRDELFPDLWLDVPVNHFNLFDNRTWKMRYKMSSRYFKKGHPLFIEVGGEWTISGSDFIGGQLQKLAEKHHGMLVETEHRYYGKSLPFGTNFSTENLKYLQMEQALEDLAYFIVHFKEITPGAKNSKVIVHGSSYPGMLVTWMRLRFPHIVDIAYASSAPLGVGFDYPGFYEVVNDVYANVSAECVESIRAGFEQTEKLMETTEGRKIVRKALRKWKCGDVKQMSAFEILDTYRSILNTMYDPVRYADLSCLVLSMDTDDTEPFERLANLMKLKSKDQGTCDESEDNESEEETSTEETSTEEVSTEDERNNISWSYQTCTEIGTFITLNRTNPRHPFARDLSVQDSVEDCVRDFGEMVTVDVLLKGTERVTRRYGGLKPKVTKVLTVQGTYDPWTKLAVFEDYTPEAPVWVFQGSHGFDVTERDDDPEDLLELRDRIRNQISTWIEEIS